MRIAMNLLSIEHLSKSYSRRQLFDDTSFFLQEGEKVGIIGINGTGKTTLLKMINGLLMPDKGQIFVDGQDVRTADQTRLRRGIGYAIQNVGLFPHMTVRQNIAYVPSLSKKWNKKEEEEQTRMLLKTVGLEASMADRYPLELSGGQKQRVGIARALAAKPSLMLMDEPFGAVDSITRKGLQKELKRLHKEMTLTILFVTHDIREALLLGDRVLIMEAGKLVRLGTPEEVKKDPGSDFVVRLLDEN